MNELKIISIGKELDHPFIDTIGYRSDFSLLDYDFAIWDPNNLLSEYQQTDLAGYTAIDSDDIFHIQEDISRRKTEMLEFLDLGRTIFIFTPKPQKYLWGKKVNDLSGSFPVNDLRTIAASGAEIEFSGRSIFNSFWKSNKEYLTYRAYFEKNIGEPLFYIKNTKKVIGSYLPLKKGHLIFIPNFLDQDFEFEVDPEEHQALSKNFVDSLIEIVYDLDNNNNDFKLPKWCSRYSLPGERDRISSLEKLHSELDLLNEKIESQIQFLANLRKHKILFAGDGRALELEVAKVFSELGFEVAEGDKGRDDLIIKYNEKIAVVEVKGVSKSAAEKHGTQLEKWVSEAHLKNEIKAKGILVINAFKDMPLEERNENPFPDQMLPYSQRREHCLITGVQLLGLYLDCKNDPTKKEKMIELLFNTNGIFGQYNEWAKYLSINGIFDDKK